MKRSVVALLLLTAGALAHGMGWADLWSRPDQQSLAQRQQAYEEIQGEQYAAAAQHLRLYSDPTSQYNRGNALAHAGDLQAALSAYDAVLRDAAAGRGLQKDARHNRDLVAEQMKSQPQSGKPGKQSDTSAQDGRDSHDGTNPKDGKNQKDDKTSGADHHAADQQDAGRGDKSQRDQPSNGAQAQDAGASPAESAASTPSAAPPAQAMGNPASEGQANPADTRAGDAVAPPQTEQTQSLDQWLRWIPDDPSGLLRRKFMIEHMLHQREAQQ